MAKAASNGGLEAFIARSQGREGGQERANYALLLSELCTVLDVKRPDPASAKTEENDYVFERVVKEPQGDCTFASRRIQIPKFGTPTEKAEQIEADLGGEIVAEKKPSFPADDIDQTAAVMTMLAASEGPASPIEIATRFKQGKRIEKKVEAVLSSLARMGVIATAKSGRAFSLHRTG